MQNQKSNFNFCSNCDFYSPKIAILMTKPKQLAGAKVKFIPQKNTKMTFPHYSQNLFLILCSHAKYFQYAKFILYLRTIHQGFLSVIFLIKTLKLRDGILTHSAHF